MTSIVNIFWSFIGAFTGIATIHLSPMSSLSSSDYNLVVGSFGASAVLIYGAVDSPLAQPRNLIGGHIISALIGVYCYQLLAPDIWLAAALAVASAIVAMHLTKTLHPPGGATALIAVIGSPALHKTGFFYALVPIARGAFILLVIALIVNNIPKGRRYPKYW